MTETNGNKVLTKVCQIASNMMHPLLMLTYAAIFLCCFTPLLIIPTGLKWFLIIEVFFYTFVIPVITIFLLYKLKLISNLRLSERKDRSIPLMVNFLVYSVCAFSLTRHGFIPMWAMCFYYGAIGIALVGWIVSYWWKISGHALGTAGLTTAIWILYMHFHSFMPLWLPMAAMIITGFVCSSRLYLGRHTLAQVYTGVLVSVVIVELAYAVFI